MPESVIRSAREERGVLPIMRAHSKAQGCCSSAPPHSPFACPCSLKKSRLCSKPPHDLCPSSVHMEHQVVDGRYEKRDTPKMMYLTHI